MRIDKYRSTVVQEAIDNYTYTSSKFPALTQVELLFRVTKILGERGVQVLFAVLVSGSKPSVKRGARYASAIVQLAYGLAEDPALIRDLLVNTKVNKYRIGEKGGSVVEQINTHFQGELPHLLNVVLFVLKHNYLGFTQGFLSMLGNPTSVATAEETPSSSPSPSAGSGTQPYLPSSPG